MKKYDVLVSFDVKELYPSVNTQEIANVVNEKLEKKFGKNKIADVYVRSSNIVINESYFSFDGQFYKQINGLLMGSPISGILVEFKLRGLGANIPDNNGGKIKTWLRYVNDVFVVIK